MTEDVSLAEPATRPRRTVPGLYDPVGWVLVRAPLLPVEAYLAIGSADEPTAHDPLVRTALAVGSRDLLPALERSDAGGPRARAKLLRYLIRMSTRPTPYGLFAGVGLARLGGATDLRIGATPPRTRMRPDMAWLLTLVARLEARPEVRRAVRVVTNPAARLHGDRAYLAAKAVIGEGDDASPVHLRATSAVRRALDLAREPVPLARLAEELCALPGATPEKVQALLDTLCEQTFLLTELRPPLTGPSPARHVADRLADVAAATDERAALTALLEAMTAWDALEMRERPAAHRALAAAAATAVPEADGAGAQVDAALPLEGGLLHKAIGREVADAAELLLRLSPNEGGRGALDGYRHAFVSRYGTDREVPLLELLDRDHGLGPPAFGPGGEAVDPARLALRAQVLRGLAVGALRERRLEVELDRSSLERIALSRPAEGTAPVSLDVAVFVLARSPEAIDAGAFELLIGPNLGAQQAGRNLGRFADLLGDAGTGALAEVAAAEARQGDGVLAELVYLPPRPRSANVVIRPAIHRHEITVGTMPGVAAEHAIPLSEVLVGVRDGRFYARWPGTGGDLRIRAGHMLNPHGAPVACRFLEEVGRDGRMLLGSFGWGPAADLPFLPRVRSGRVILAAAQWRIDCAMRDAALAPADPDFAAAVGRFRAAWTVPRHVYLTAGDNRLLLDLEAPGQAEELRAELRRLRDGDVVVLQEPLPGPEHAWLAGPHGGHLAELVVPVALRRAASPGGGPRAAGPRRRAAPVTTDRLRPPGSDWLFLKLYCARDAEEDLLTGPVHGFARFALGAGLADGWFFLRYADPDTHLRVRLRGSPERLVARLLPEACAWAGELVADGSCGRFAVDTYEREIERYGGLDGVRAAEDLFAADSTAVAELLRLARDGLPTIDRTSLGVLSVDALLGALGLGAPERLQWCRAVVGAGHHSGDDYRARRQVLRRLLGDPAACRAEPDGDALAGILAARATALAPVAARLRDLATRGRLDAPLQRLCESYVHMHCNRLLGEGPPAEQHVLGLLLRTLEGLGRAPAS
jgi:thiopeptide-type bacteriocin biosynthesis protein